jgi:lysyl-tRNA synthetase, class II
MLEDIRNERIKKLELLRRSGAEPYPARVKRTAIIRDVIDNFEKLEKSKEKIFIAGRVLGYRDQGNIIFLDVKDESGQVQAILGKIHLKNFPLIKKTVDRGDFVSVGGRVVKTKRGEMSIEATDASIISKSLRPLPTEHFGIEDIETRLRERYLDLILNPETKEMFHKKALFWTTIRNFLMARGFLEVQTPGLELIAGGADAEPFKTHHNALNADFFLRISLELPLKKLLVGGFEKVFEIGRVFRNEGIDREHLQDYMALEFYWAYANYADLMTLLENMYREVIKAVCGSTTTEWQGKKIQWGKKWAVIDYAKAFKKENKIDVTKATRGELAKCARELGLEVAPEFGKGRLMDMIYKKTIRPFLVQPTFLVGTPIEISPLAKRSSEKPGTVERLQIVACGTELGNGFSELNDPLDQRTRFEEQMKLREAGDKEAQPMDEEYLKAMEYGMPPAAGFGLSERVFSILMGKPIRETVFFPLMREKNEKRKDGELVEPFPLMRERGHRE